jgi:hypothetical protein
MYSELFKNDLRIVNYLQIITGENEMFKSESKINDTLPWLAEWTLHKFNDPNDEIAHFLQHGGTIEQAVKRFGDQFIETLHWTEKLNMQLTKQIEKLRRLGRLGLQEGRAELIDIICGLGTPVKWDATNAYLGVGDSNATPADTQTGLQAATNKLYKAMDSTYPQRSGQTAEWRSTFGSAEANFAWEEYTVSNTNADTGKNLNRCIASKGTKVSGESWTLSLKITFNAS